MTIAERNDSVIDVLPRFSADMHDHFGVRTGRWVKHAPHPERGHRVLIKNPGLGGGTASLSHRANSECVTIGWPFARRSFDELRLMS